MKENNILLAEFLGWEGVANNKTRFRATLPYYITIEEVDFDFRDIKEVDIFETAFDDMKFNSDWDWLMLVVEKIESLETSKGSTFTIDFHRDSVLIFEYGKYTNEIVFTEGLGRMQNLYNACIAFVKWYNDNK